MFNNTVFGKRFIHLRDIPMVEGKVEAIYKVNSLGAILR